MVYWGYSVCDVDWLTALQRQQLRIDNLSHKIRQVQDEPKDKAQPRMRRHHSKMLIAGP